MRIVSTGVPKDVRMRAFEIVLECMHKAEVHFGRSYNTPKLEFNLRGRNGGVARGGHTIDLNPVLMMENLEEYYTQVIPHEVAHIIDTANGDNARPDYAFTRLRNGRIRRAKREIHGPSWKFIMSRIFGLEPDRCHQMDTTNAAVRNKRNFEYACDSCKKPYFIGPVRHRRQQQHASMSPGASFYTCNRCGRTRGKLVYIGIKSQTPRIVEQKAANAPAPANVFNSMGPQGAPGKMVFEGMGITVAKAIMMKYGYHLTRGQFIVRAVEAGLKATTASTYYNQLRRKV